jgi:Bacterial regulatory proteins, luxR family
LPIDCSSSTGVAEGPTNASSATALVVTERTVETHMHSIFQKLRIPDSGDRHRRVIRPRLQARPSTRDPPATLGFELQRLTTQSA